MDLQEKQHALIIWVSKVYLFFFRTQPLLSLTCSLSLSLQLYSPISLSSKVLPLTPFQVFPLQHSPTIFSLEDFFYLLNTHSQNSL